MSVLGASGFGALGPIPTQTQFVLDNGRSLKVELERDLKTNWVIVTKPVPTFCPHLGNNVGIGRDPRAFKTHKFTGFAAVGARLSGDQL
jgi:hypothetical protein